jgi:hypothetical protein
LAAIPDTVEAALTKDAAETIMATFMAPAVLRKAKTKAKKQMATQMRWFCFSRQYVSGRTFEGKYFRQIPPDVTVRGCRLCKNESQVSQQLGSETILDLPPYAWLCY